MFWRLVLRTRLDGSLHTKYRINEAGMDAMVHIIGDGFFKQHSHIDAKCHRCQGSGQ